MFSEYLTVKFKCYTSIYILWIHNICFNTIVVTKYTKYIEKIATDIIVDSIE